MSDTAPKNQDALLAGHAAPPTPRTRGEEAWRVTRDGHTIACELRDESPLGGGWDVMIRQDGEVSFSRRCPDEACARFAANGLLHGHLKAGWTESKWPDLVDVDEISCRSAFAEHRRR
jgi:hypothetical protein